MKKHLRHLIDSVGNNYFQLILVSKADAIELLDSLKKVDDNQFCLLRVGKEVSRKMLDLTKRQRSLNLPKLLEEVTDSCSSDIVILSDIEMLFDPDLNHDPLRLLQEISRNRHIVVVWPGKITKNRIEYAVPDHREYRSYEIHEFLVMNMNDK